jgi:hypothetical protein
MGSNLCFGTLIESVEGRKQLQKGQITRKKGLSELIDA